MAKLPKHDKVSVSGHALDSVAAVLASPKLHERSPEEKAYDRVCQSVTIKDGHRQARPTKDVVKHKGQRLYSVTTIAASPRYGGRRTVAICSSFERAKATVEKNKGDIYEYSYQLVVIEATVADWLYGGMLNEQYWYVWKGTPEEGGYTPIERPKAYKYAINIGGIG